MMAVCRLSSYRRGLLMLTKRCDHNRVCLTDATVSISSGSGVFSLLYSTVASPYQKTGGSLWSLKGSYCSHFSNDTTVVRGEKHTHTQRKVRQYNPPKAQNKSTNHKHHQGGNSHKHHRTPFHSIRLINESAARETTKLFTQLQKESSQKYITNVHSPWRDRASLLAAEQALEFWAHRNNQQQRNNGQRKNNFGHSHRLETDAQTALDLFTSLHYFHIQEAKLSDGVSVLTNAMYSHVIDALSKSPKMEHVSEADRLLRQFISLYVVENSTSIKGAHDDMQSTLLSLGLPFHDATNDIDEQSSRLSIPASISWNYKDKHHFPNQIRITGVMRGQVRQLRPVEAESLLHLQIKLAYSLQRNPFQPNEIGYATLIDGYSRTCDGENAERILQLMKGRLGDDTYNGANIVAYNAAISAWARSASRADTATSESRRAAEKAEQLLREMWSLQRESIDNRVNNQILPDVVSYSSVISAYASCLDRSFGLKRAEELLRELEAHAEKECNESMHDFKQQQKHVAKSRGGGRHPDGFRLNSTVYNALLQAYANAGDTSSAERLLERMISLHSRSLKEGGGGPFRNVSPNTRTFNVVLNTWAKKGTREAGAKANELLRIMEDMSTVHEDGINQPDTISYNTVLAAWSKSAAYGKAPSEAEEIVGKEAAYKALELLDLIEQSYRIKPDRISYNTAISAFANAAQTCESGVLMAQEADALISRMRDRMGIEPDDYSFNGVLLAWSRSSGGMSSAQHCESILRNMKNPTNVSWSTVINAYAHAGGALEAAALLKEMEDIRLQSGSHASDILPIVVYNNLLHAWSRNSDPDASKYAESILNRLESGSISLNLPKPDVISYRLVLNALEHTKDFDKAERAKSILARFIASLPADLNTIDHQLKDEIRGAYNSVLAACAYTPSNAGDQARNDAARILVETLQDLNNSKDITLGPNLESFSVFIQGCTHLFQPDSSDRALLMRSALKECCEKGLLDSKIWDKFCKASSEEEVQSFFAGFKKGHGSFATLPIDWSRNAAPSMTK
ncbi:hypothetical protein ACHAXM_003445 [Skeletonema potamos]